MSDYLIEEDKDKPVKIIYQYEYCDLDNHLKTDYLIGKAKNRTIGEIWKGIEQGGHRKDSQAKKGFPRYKNLMYVKPEK